MDIRMLCLGCMRQKNPALADCPYCGFSLSEYERHRNSEVLRAGTILAKRYVVGKMLGKGGFGITYLGWDGTLSSRVAIKEYFPVGVSVREALPSRGMAATQVRPTSMQSVDLYNKGLRDQEKEAVMLANIGMAGTVNVLNFFRENGTGYIVMEYVDGVDLRKYVRDQGQTLGETRVLAMMRQVVIALGQIHQKHVVHRDISPDNIMIDKHGNAVLIDFGSARMAMADSNHTMTVMLKHGYAPPEQYSSTGGQGSWTDVYALCATMYYLMTGVIPANSVDRLSRENDTLLMTEPLRRSGISPRTQRALLAGLAPMKANRIQDMPTLYRALYEEGTIPPEGTVPIRSLQGDPARQDPAFRDHAENTNDDRTQGEGTGRVWMVLGIAAGILLALALLLFLLGAFRNRNSASSKGQETATASAAEQADALFEQGMQYYRGDGVSRDLDQAKQYFEQASAAGSAQAGLFLGSMYETGEVTGHADYQTAREYYLKSYEGGETRSAYHLGEFYEEGLGVAVDTARAREYYEAATAQEGTWGEEHWAALYRLAGLVRAEAGERSDAALYASAREDYTRIAEGESALTDDGAFRRAQMDYAGEGLSGPDYASAFTYYQQAADLGHAGALNELGRLCEKGQGTEQDYGKAYAYYDAAVDAGSSVALYNLGLLYENGYGVEKNIDTAMDYYRKATEKGVTEAEKRLRELEKMYPAS